MNETAAGPFHFLHMGLWVSYHVMTSVVHQLAKMHERCAHSSDPDHFNCSDGWNRTIAGSLRHHWWCRMDERVFCDLDCSRMERIWHTAIYQVQNKIDNVSGHHQLLLNHSIDFIYVGSTSVIAVCNHLLVMAYLSQSTLWFGLYSRERIWHTSIS
jgi:hypothetical protein